MRKNDNPRKEHEDAKPETDIINAFIEARKAKNITQKELAERIGMNQADISKIENGLRNPSLNMLKKLAAGIDATLEIKFVPQKFPSQ